jgi:hypothetical protein
MGLLTLDEVRSLAAHRAEHSISIYMPTRRNTGEAHEGPTRLKNAVAAVQRELLDRDGGAARKLQPMLERALALHANGAFWRRQAEGLAVFAAPDFFRAYNLPAAFEQATVVGRCFHVTPLLTTIENGTAFYVVAISKNGGARLLHGSEHSVNEVDLPGAPESLESLFFDADTRADQQYCTLGRAEGGPRGAQAMFHGHGGTSEPWEERTLHYFRQIDAEVARALQEVHAPLIFAGDVTLMPLYQQANTYRGFQKEFVRGHPDRLSLQELHDLAWPILQNMFREKRRTVIERVQNSIAAEKGSTKLSSVVHNAVKGRNEVVLIPPNGHRWGRYNGAADEVQVLPQREAGAEDLLNVAASHTLVNSGRVLLVPREEMPEGADAAAAFRY